MLASDARQDAADIARARGMGSRSRLRTPSTPALRKEFRDHHQRCDAIRKANKAIEDFAHQTTLQTGRIVRPRLMALPRLPQHLATLQCGAKTRAGTPCKMISIYENARCQMHGGLSTGPKTEEGRAKALANLKRRWNPMDASQNLTPAQPAEIAADPIEATELQSRHSDAIETETPKAPSPPPSVTERARSLLAELYGE